MILYLDSSAFVKLYVAESVSNHVRYAIESASAVYTHLLTYAEIRAAMAKAFRLKRISAGDLAAFKQKFEQDWRETGVLLPVEELIYRAGDLAEQHSLRGYDSIHLASAEALHLNSLPGGACFGCFDLNLNAAAKNIGLRLLTQTHQDVKNAP